MDVRQVLRRRDFLRDAAGGVGMMAMARLLADEGDTWTQLVGTLRAAPLSLCSVSEVEGTDALVWAATVHAWRVPSHESARVLLAQIVDAARGIDRTEVAA